MPISSTKALIAVFACVSLASCGGSDGSDGVAGKDGEDGAPALVSTSQEPAGLNCQAGGWKIEAGSDRNGNGSLDGNEVSSVSYACNGKDGQNGQDGSDGTTALVDVTPVGVSAECTAGGYRVDSGLDLNNNDVLDSGEVQDSAFICDGEDGADGISALITTEIDNTNAVCSAGGIRVLSGIDVNRNGQLDAGEETQTSYLCNGEAGQDGESGASALLASTQVPAGGQCIAGGYRIDTGLDADGNGLLEGTEVTSNFYVCNGADGENGLDGADGLQSLVDISTEAPGVNCEGGGKLIESGADLNWNGILDAGEVQQSGYLCNGKDGLNGSDGQDGTDGSDGADGLPGEDGSNSLMSSTEEPAGANCAAGGVEISSGIDVDDDNILDSAEIQSTSYVCHGAGGADAQSFILQYSAQAGGSIIGTSVQEVLLGESGESVTAAPDNGYYFTAWSDGNASASRVDSSVQSDLDVVAGFAIYQYTLIYTAGDNGSLSGIVGQTVFHGADGTAVEAIPDEGFHFTQWSDGSVQNPRTEIAVEEDVSVNASFAVNEYSLVYQAGSGGSIMGNATQTVTHSNNGSVVAAVPDSGYQFVGWSDGVTTANRTDQNVQADLQVTAEFREQLSPPEEVSTGVDNGSLELSWESNPYADSYNVYYALETGVTPSSYSGLAGGGMLSNVSSPVTLSELDGGQRYYFVITTVIDGVESAAGNEVSLLLPNTPWLVSAHQGRLRADVTSAETARVDWDVAFGESYNLYVSKDPETDLSQYASYGAELRLNVTPPVTLNNLVIDEPVYVALEVNGEVKDWTNVVSRTWGVNDAVKAQVLGADGTRYVGGDFTMAGMNAGKVAAFPIGNNAAAPHLLSMPQANGSVHAVASDGRGGWYIGGEFTKVGQVDRLRLAHFDAAGRLTDWNPGANDTVFALEFHEDTVYVGGDFTAAGNGVASIARNKLASFDVAGNLTPWNPYANGTVRAFAIGDGAIFAGGDFSQIGGGSSAVSSKGLAKFGFDGNLESWRTVPGHVNDLAFRNGYVVVGGSFTIGSQPNSNQYYAPDEYRSNIAAFSASTGYMVSWRPIADDEVTSIVIDDADIVYFGAKGRVGRQVYGYESSIYTYSVNYCSGGLARMALPSASAVGCIDGGSTRAIALSGNGIVSADESNTVFGADGGLVNAMASDGGTVVVAGDFDVAAGPSRLRLAAFDPKGFLKEWNPGADASVRALAINNGSIYAGGDFTLSGGGVATTSREHLASYDSSGNLLSWNPGVDRRVNAISVDNNLIYVGGHFVSASDSSGTQTRRALAAFDATGNLLSWNPGADSYVNALAVSNGLVYAGGDFTSAGGGTGTVTRNYLAAFDFAGNLSAWSGEANDEVVSISLDGGTLYASGKFTAAGGSTGSAARNRLAAFGINGDLTSWNPGLSGGIASSLFASGGLVYAGGNFTGAQGGSGGVMPVKGLAAFTASGEISGWSPEVDGSVSNIVSDGLSLYIGGEFTKGSDQFRESAKSRLAVFDLNGELLDQY